jgi:hypothetical protein
MLSPPATGFTALLGRLTEIGVQRIVLSTPRPWHPGKLEALAAALILRPGVQAFGLVTGQVEVLARPNRLAIDRPRPWPAPTMAMTGMAVLPCRV